jgi:hypothetical protein
MAKKAKGNEFLKVLKENVSTFSQSTPLLAIPFIGEPGRPYTERFKP